MRRGVLPRFRGWIVVAAIAVAAAAVARLVAPDQTRDVRAIQESSDGARPT